MKLFVATESLEEDGDFSFTIPGELVHLPTIICAAPDCGCDRAMSGFVSHKGTTCFVVRELHIDATSYIDLLFSSLRDSGWVDDSSEDRDWVEDWAAEHVRIGAELPAEVPLRFDRDRVMVRHLDHFGWPGA